ncbi:MAG TPA: hypothetical protein H9761_14880 [Candidatus Eisenbergiella merdavium]|uniref:Uncharacterized protein n=1 Tax=Candidatus Eisenbergiella merdavium TaxID=2838551 RepID=A0A9D2NJN8_9FIRM|nr:hypothetical protein [Candidatus Eisenbergiella merdavium]
MVTVRIYNDGELVEEMGGDFAVCITETLISGEDELYRRVALRGDISIRRLRDALSFCASKLLAQVCRRTGRSKDDACRVISGFMHGVMNAGAENILDAYKED